MSSNSVTLNDLDVKKLTKIWKLFDKLFGYNEPIPGTKAQIVKVLRADRNFLFDDYPGLRRHPLMTWRVLSTISRKSVNILLKIVHESKWNRL